MRSAIAAVGLMAMLLRPVWAQEINNEPPQAVIEVALRAATDYLDSFGVASDHLVVRATVEIDWPDSSLGCAQPGLAYAQIVTPGYVVTVDTDDRGGDVEVHTDGGSRGVIC